MSVCLRFSPGVLLFSSWTFVTAGCLFVCRGYNDYIIMGCFYCVVFIIYCILLFNMIIKDGAAY